MNFVTNYGVAKIMLVSLWVFDIMFVLRPSRIVGDPCSPILTLDSFV